MFSRFVGMSALFGISIQQIFFSPLLLFQNSIPSFHFTSQNLIRTLFIFFFLTLSFFLFFFQLFFFSFFFEFSHKPSRWNKLIKFHLKTLWIRALRRKGSTGWLAIMYQKRKTHIWLKVDKNGIISSLKDWYSSFNINDFKRFKYGKKSFFFLGQKKEQWNYNKGNMLSTSKWTKIRNK